ncbi:MAG TPA: LON peptidase substrate-binding domain-containing protein [Pyrinomonadaceae bacterium]|jgi:Lon protease-like protein|nr:LON peptidase substrate-binding domain-containing protein [Pyrinomonadaceae bacterium]
MSEALEKVRGVRELPLFPLPLVLFPGVPLPLHIFEPRYREMLEDVQAKNNMFGVSYFEAGETGDEHPPSGHVGCVAEVVEVQTMRDGRSNIMTLGVARYRVESYVETGEPYLVGRVEFFEDEPEDDELLNARAREVLNLFVRIANSVRVLNDERGSLPEIPEASPERLSFLVASAMEIDAGVKQEMLELRLSSERLGRLQGLLAQVVGGYEERARMHTIGKGNGHGGKKINFS